MPNATTTTLFNNIRARVPGVVDGVLKQAVFDTCDELSRDALNATPATDATADESTFLAALVWPTAYQPVLDGTLARLYAQPGKSWTSLDLAKVHQDRYMVLLTLLRADTLSVVASTVYTRLLNTVQQALPLVRQQVVVAEIYNTVDKLRREALNLTPLTDADDLPAEWLTTTQYSTCYQAILSGTMYRLLGQTGKPWSNPELAKANFDLYQQELSIIRTGTATPAATGFARIMDATRQHLPGVSDNILKQELFNVIDEFLSRTNISQQSVNFSTVIGQKTYTVTPSGNTSLVRLLYVTDAAGLIVAATMPTFGTVTLQTAPSTVATLTARVSVSCSIVDGSGYPSDVPATVLDRYYDAFSCGVLSRMMLQPAKQYTNLKLAQYHGKRFSDAANACRQEVMQQNLMGGQAWRFPQSFSTSRGYFR